jgi:uncharacterized membrane protein YhaH (DUF805 family)
MDFGYLYTSFDGRINRKPYWMGTLLLIAGWIILLLVLTFAGVGVGSRAFAAVVLIIQLIMLYPSSALMIKRLHDRNHPSWWVAFILVPVILNGLTNALGITGDPLNQNALDYLFMAVTFIIGIWFFIELGCLRGTVGPNEYGPDPLRGDIAVARR